MSCVCCCFSSSEQNSSKGTEKKSEETKTTQDMQDSKDTQTSKDVKNTTVETTNTSSNTQSTTSNNQATNNSTQQTSNSTQVTNKNTESISNNTEVKKDVQVSTDTKEADDTKKVENQNNNVSVNDKNVSDVKPSVNVDDEKKVEQDNIVIRKEIRSMSKQEQNRFFDAIDTMLKAPKGPGTSVFFKLAAFHGGPGPAYCSHGRQTFPGWHRIYLREFELAVQQADKDNGNDGNIFLPYWNWSEKSEEGLPQIIRDRFNTWPNDLFPSNVKHPAKLIRADDKLIARNIESFKVIEEATNCMRNTQHWLLASTGNESGSLYNSLEAPHNSMHVIVGGRGGSMSSVPWAAFDLAFWLHHCNIDRIYEGYIQMEPDSQEEFESYEKTQDEDLYLSGFEPFRKPDGSKYYPKDTFSTVALGYKYQDVPPPPANRLILQPILVVFPQVKIYQFESRCFQIHCFVMNKDSDDFKAPKTSHDIDYDSPNYGGAVALFGRGTECKNCLDRPPVDLIINIANTVRNKLRLSREQVAVKTYVLDVTGDSDDLLTIEQTQLPQPVVVGGLFSQESTLEQKNRQNQNSSEVRSLQQYLKTFGYYNEVVDGDFGPVTEKAVKYFQTALNLPADGIVTKQIKQVISTKKRCHNPDSFAENNVVDDETIRADYGNKSKLLYFVDSNPGYLKREHVLKAVDLAFSQWQDAIGADVLTFERTDKHDKADINISWSPPNYNGLNDILRFDHDGGVVGKGGHDGNSGYVVLSFQELWAIGLDGIDKQDVSDLNDPKTWWREKPMISMYHTILHELGHTLGLDHSKTFDDIMSPFYDPSRNTLTKNDCARMKALWRE